MTRSSKIALSSLGTVVLLVLFLVHGCERIVEQTISFPPPLGEVAFKSFSVLEWVTTPSQEVTIRLKQQSDIKQLVDLRAFGDFQPEITDEVATAKFGKPTQTRTDDFGGTWSRYSTPLGYVEIGLDRRTSPTDDDKNPVPGRRSLRAYTDKLPGEIFRPPFLSVIRAAEQMTPRADYYEFYFFDSDNDLVLAMWLKKGRIDYLELFKHIDR